MKIISKYKDFYDFIVQDHDAELTYVRHGKLVNEYLDDLFRTKTNSIPFYSKYYGYQDTYIGRRNNGEMIFDNFVFGIYPFVFSQPIIRIYYKHKASGNIENFFVILGRELVDKILDSNESISQSAIDFDLKEIAQLEYDKLVNKHLCDYVKVHFAKYNKLADIQKSLKMHVWKVDCPDIFYKIESPVFVKYNYDLIVNGAYWDNWLNKPRIGKSKDTYYIADISFQKLNYNILKYWYNDLFDLNTYINIENFLWSIKQEPEAKPDNKTKIMAHGFDLKTSFRKCKNITNK